MKLSDWLPGVPVESNVMEPCPCCGSEKTTRWVDIDGLARGGCLTCGLTMFAATVSGVLIKWNKRHVPWVDPKVRLPEIPRLSGGHINLLILLEGELDAAEGCYSKADGFTWGWGEDAITSPIAGWMYLPKVNNVQEYYERSKKDASDAE